MQQPHAATQARMDEYTPPESVNASGVDEGNAAGVVEALDEPVA